jgi:hypothetical protein
MQRDVQSMGDLHAFKLGGTHFSNYNNLLPPLDFTEWMS